MKSKFLIIISVILLTCCKVDGQKKQVVNSKRQYKSHLITKNDSLLIQKLVKNVYKWNAGNKIYYFNIGIEDKERDKYIGIDWTIYENNKKMLKNSGLFSDDFISLYKETLKQIDIKVKNKEYDWFIGEYPPFGTDGNEWCHCQDTPNGSYWNDIEIKNIKLIQENTVSLTWNWGKKSTWSKGFSYPVKVKKENNIWKVIYLDGFDKKYY